MILPVSGKQKIIVLAGPTAVGKTELSLTIAEDVGCEIISMDSMQIYKYMDIGTAKPTMEERSRVLHHLLDFVDPAEPYNVARFIKDAEKAIEQISSSGRLPMLVGGTGLYMKGLLEGVFEMPDVSRETRNEVQRLLQEKGQGFLYDKLQKVDPESAARLHMNDSQRITRAYEIYRATGIPWSSYLAEHQRKSEQHKFKYDVVKIGLQRERDNLYERINSRVDIMVEQGLFTEVEGLLSMGYAADLNSMKSIGYKHMVHFIEKKWTWDESLEKLARDTRHYAKRQLTWFGGDSEMTWFHPREISRVRNFILESIEA